MQDKETLLGRIIRSKTQYWSIVIGFIFSVILYVLFAYAGLFIYWGLYGEGASSDEQYHPIAAKLIYIVPLLVIMGIYIVLMLYKLKLQQLSDVKSYLVLSLLMIMVYILRGMLYLSS